ncbi:MAG: hypothetical protein WAO08_13725 [Hyphomicrobiaceae bacterium]
MVAVPVAIKVAAVGVAMHVPMVMAVAVISVDMDIAHLVHNAMFGWGHRIVRRGTGCCCAEC